MGRIHELRRRIDEIDKKIIELLDERMNVVKEIGRVKKEMNMEVRDSSREDVVLSRAGIYRNIFQEIIRLAVDIQERPSKADVKEIEDVGKRKIGVVGFGKMGRLFAQIFSRHHEIGIYDIREIDGGCGYRIFKDLKSLVKQMEYILVSTPLKETPYVLKTIKNIIKNNKLTGKKVFDITTIKWRVIKELQSFPRDVNVCSIHPLFGGKIEDTRGKKIVVVKIKGRDEEDIEEVIDIFKPYHFNIFIASQEEHDKAVGLTIGLPYFIALLYGETILLRDMKKLDKYGGTSYQVYKDYINNILLNDDPYFIQELLNDPYTRSAIEGFKHLLYDEHIITSGDHIKLFFQRWRQTSGK